MTNDKLSTILGIILGVTEAAHTNVAALVGTSPVDYIGLAVAVAVFMLGKWAFNKKSIAKEAITLP